MFRRNWSFGVPWGPWFSKALPSCVLGPEDVRGIEVLFSQQKNRRPVLLASVGCSLHMIIQADYLGSFLVYLSWVFIYTYLKHTGICLIWINSQSDSFVVFGAKEITTAKTFGVFLYNIVFQCNVLMWTFCVMVVLLNFDQMRIWMASDLIFSG